MYEFRVRARKIMIFVKEIFLKVSPLVVIFILAGYTVMRVDRKGVSILTHLLEKVEKKSIFLNYLRASSPEDHIVVVVVGAQISH
jgi:hypothetical protein